MQRKKREEKKNETLQLKGKKEKIEETEDMAGEGKKKKERDAASTRTVIGDAVSLLL